MGTLSQCNQINVILRIFTASTEPRGVHPSHHRHITTPPPPTTNGEAIGAPHVPGGFMELKHQGASPQK